MKLKQARQLVKAIADTAGVYSPEEVAGTLARLECSRSNRRPGEWAELLASYGRPGMALDLLLRTPIREW